MLNKVLSNKFGELIGWQVCSLILCGIGALSSLMADLYGFNLPLLILTICDTLFIIGTSFPPPRSEAPWWPYMIIGVVMVIGDYTSILAYEMTSFASALLLVTATVFWVPPVSYFVFKRKLKLLQGIAIVVGMVGVSLVMVADGVQNSKLKGNLIALASSFCYTCTTVLQELLVHSNSVKLYLFRMGCVAAPIGAIFAAIIERNKIIKFPWSIGSVAILLGDAVCMALYGSLAPIVMQHSNATVMNLSMLTSNFFSLGISILAFNMKASWLYLVGFLCTPIAIVIYSLATPKEEEEGKRKNIPKNTSEYESFDALQANQ